MKYLNTFYPESEFGGFSEQDGTIRFYQRINALIEPGMTVLDIGCGRAAYRDDQCRTRRDLRILKGKCRRVVGIDVDPGAAENPFIDEFHLLESSQWPLADASIDIAIADYVLEHVESPEGFFSECKRVVRPGGYVCFRTPNAWSYPALIARMVPNRHHATITAKTQLNRQAKDVFPTFYRCNTRRSLRRYLRRAHFAACVFGHEAEPAYFEFSRIAYWIGVMHQRYAPRLFKTNLFAFARRLG